MATPAREVFRFDADTHEYIDADGVVLPHITGMLEAAGWVDDTWMTEESSERGTEIHRLTARYDLHALQLRDYHGPYRPQFLAYVTCSQALKPAWWSIEVPRVHPLYRFGGRPDRTGTALQQQSVLEVKSGELTKAHQVQTALQAILVAANETLPAQHWLRLALYLKPSGRFKLEQHKSRADFDEAYRILRTYYGRCL